MFERRPTLGFLIGLTICVSIWRISLQEPSLLSNEIEFKNQYQQQGYRQLQEQIEEKSSLPTTVFRYEAIATTSSGQLKVRKSNLNRHNLDDKRFHKISPLNNEGTVAPKKSLSSTRRLSSDTVLSEAIISPDELPKDDFNTLIDLKDFKFLINQLPCATGDVTSAEQKLTPSPTALILVHSGPRNYVKRSLIRETWGSVKGDKFRLIFLLGAVNDKKVQHDIEIENASYGDLVQGNFIDAYRNMTYKHTMALKWFTYYCPHGKFLIKVDDDVFVNTWQIIEYLDELLASAASVTQTSSSMSLPQRTYHVPSSSSSLRSSVSNSLANQNTLSSSQKDFLFCQKVMWSRVKRSYRSKWRVSTKEYSGRYYPPYCPGYSIVYSPDVVFRLYREAQKTRYFWIDDVHVTGTLAQQSNITITSFQDYVLKKEDGESILAGKTDISSVNKFLFTWPDINEAQIRQLWLIVQNASSKALPKLFNSMQDVEVRLLTDIR